MPLVSSKVAAGTEILADHFNKLRADLLTNHDHSAGKGGTVDHKDLAETDAMSGMDHEHGDIDVHLGQAAGPGPTAIDNPGGDKGVHGLASAAYVAGSIDEAGVAKQLVFRTGIGTIVKMGGGNYGFTVTFSPAFSALPKVFATYQSQSAGAAASLRWRRPTRSNRYP